MKRLGAVVAAVVMVAGAAWAEGPAATRWGKLPRLKEGKVVELKQGRVRIARETTRITEPLGEDGMVDYVAAINAYYGKGVTPENNAYVRLIDVFGRQALPEETGADQLALLGLKSRPPGDGKYFVDFAAYERKRTGVMRGYKDPDPTEGLFERVWAADERKMVAAWIKDMGGPLDIATDASKRARFFRGYMPPEDNPMLVGVNMPVIGALRSLNGALCMRAMLRLGEGDDGGAADDILAAMRLGRLHAQTPSLIERLVGVAMESVAMKTCRSAVTSGKLSDATRERLLAELAAMPEIPSFVETLDRYERYIYLDMIVTIARGRNGGAGSRERRGSQGEPGDGLRPDDGVRQRVV